MKQFLSTNKYFIAALFLIPLIALPSLSGKQGPLIELYDYWEHTASIEGMSRNLLNPTNPFLQLEGSTTLRYTPYIFLLALLKNITGCDLSTLLVFAAIINFILLTLGIFLFCKEYFNDPEQPLYTLVTLLFLWGEPFNFSSEYNLRFLAYTSFYPSEITFSLSFIGFFCFVKFVRYNRFSDYWKYLLLATFIFSTHPLTGSFFLLGIFLLALTEGSHKIKNATLYLFSVLVVLLTTVLWPYYPFFKAFQNTVTTPWAEETRGYLYATRNLYKMGAAVLGLPVILLMFLKRKYQFITYGFLLTASIYIFTYKPKIYLGERYIFYFIVFLHLALSWYLRQLRVLSFQNIRQTIVSLSEKNIHILMLVVIVIISIVYQVAKLGSEQLGYTIHFRPRPIIQKYENPVDHYQQLIGILKEGDVVVSDPLTSWLIPTLTGAKIAALYHDNPLVPDNVSRVEDMISFYDASTSLEKRKLILEKYNATHVLLNLERMEDTRVNRVNDYYKDYRISEKLTNDLNNLGHMVSRNQNIIAYKINTSGEDGLKE
jgi:hypothetical protein